MVNSFSALSSDCVLRVRDGEFTWQDDGITNTKQTRTVSKDSIHSATSSDISDSVFKSEESEGEEPPKLQDNHDASKSKTLELKEINLHITKVFVI